MQKSSRRDARSDPPRASAPLRRIRGWALAGAVAVVAFGLLACGGPASTGGEVTPSAAVTTPSAPVAFSHAPLTSWRLNGNGLATLVAGDTVYVGGTFSRATSPDGMTVVRRANLAAFSATTGDLVPGFHADADDPVRTLAYDGTNLYVGGSFTQINGIARSRLAALDPATGEVRKSWQADADSNVYGLSVGAGRLFVAGSFSTLKGAPRARIAALNVADASLTPFAPVADDTVNTIAAAGDASAVYLGGNYTSINHVATTYLTKLAPDGSVVPVPWQTVGGQALGLQVSPDGTRLAAALAGEPDTNPGANQGDVFDTKTGRKVWIERCDGDAQAIQIVGGSVYSGFHGGCEGDTTIRLTRNDFTTGARDDSFTPAFDQFWGVRGISGSSTALAIVGEFTSISGVDVHGFAVFPAQPAP